jgi:Protein of unknown function (DUF1501)
MSPESSTAGYLHRRRWLWDAGLGFGALASAALAAPSGFTRNLAAISAPLSHLKPRAKRVIFLFMEGGPSHLDLLDPKPLLNQLAGKKLPASFGTPVTSMGTAEAPLLECKRKWSRHGKGFGSATGSPTWPNGPMTCWFCVASGAMRSTIPPACAR